MTCTKSTLGRVWARYYNWYGMMGKLRAALLQHGWMEERINSYDRTNHLTVNLDHEGENPDVPAPNDHAWLRRHKPLPGGPNSRGHSCGPSPSTRKAQLSLQKEERNLTGTGLVPLPSERSTGTKNQQSC